jgi:serine/threonine protein kinase
VIAKLPIIFGLQNGTWNFGDRFELISDRAKDFIKRLLVYDFKDRMDVQTALDHSWFHLIHEERTVLPNLQRDTHSSYYYKLKYVANFGDSNYRIRINI